MNCKPGDVAMVVKSKVGNEGKIVRCLRLCTPEEADALSHWSGPLWEIDTTLRSQKHGEVRMTNHCPDWNLRPIRDPGDDAVDETILRLGKPEGVTA